MKYDIAIIGGGPAGSTAGCLLAKKGLSVILLEKESFPRPHVGESLLPFCYDIFVKLGVLDKMKEKFLRKPGAIFCNKSGEVETTYCFKHVVENPKHLSFHVRRDEFDKMLLDNARSNSVTVHESTRVSKVDISGNEVQLEVEGSNSETDTVTARFVLDASGREGVIARKNNWRRPMEDLDRVAFHSYWNFPEVPDEVKRGLIRIVYLEGDKKGWIWCIPVDNKRISIGVVVDKDSLSGFKDQRTNDKNWAIDFYESEIESSSFISNMLEEATRDEKVWINGDYSYSSKVKYGNNFALIGDSGQFIDPIFSSGVFIAMKTAQIVADVLPEYLNTKDLQLLDKSYDTIANGYETVGKLISMYYNPQMLDFSEMVTSEMGKDENDDFTEFKGAYTMLHYLLAGDFFEKGHIYKEFFESLKDGRKFKRWKSLVNWDKEESGVFYNRDERCGENLHA